MTRDEIVDALEEEREKFLAVIDGLSDEALEEPGVVGDWSVKDIIFHLSMWEADLIQFLWQFSKGEKPTTAGFLGQSIDEINASWQELSKTRSLASGSWRFRGSAKADSPASARHPRERPQRSRAISMAGRSTFMGMDCWR